MSKASPLIVLPIGIIVMCIVALVLQFKVVNYTLHIETMLRIEFCIQSSSFYTCRLIPTMV